MLKTLSQRPLRAALAATCAALAVGAAGCGGSSGDEDADPAAIAPASSPFYAEVTIRPDGALKDDAEALIKKVSGKSDIGAELRKLVEGESKHDFDEDIAPWLGKRAGVFLTSFGPEVEGAVAVASKDGDKAKDFLEKDAKEDSGKPDSTKSYKDVEYFLSGDTAQGVVGDYAVFGSERGVKAAIDVSKDSDRSLASSDDFDKALETVGTEDSLGTLYVSPTGLVNALSSSGQFPPQALTAIRQAIASSGAKATAAKLGVTADSTSIESASVGAKKPTGDQGDAAAAVAALPGDSWLGAGVGAIGNRLEQVLQQVSQISGLAGVDIDTVLDQFRQQSGLDLREDLLGWMGDGAVFLRGTALTDLGGALVVQSSDAAKSRAAVPKLGRLIDRFGAALGVSARTADIDGADEAVRVETGRIDVFVAAVDDRFVVAAGEPALEQALEPTGKLGDSASFKGAAGKLGDGIKPSFFFDLQPVLQLAEGLGATDDPDFQEAKPYLEAIAGIVAGGKTEGDTARGKLVVSVK